MLNIRNLLKIRTLMNHLILLVKLAFLDLQFLDLRELGQPARSRGMQKVIHVSAGPDGHV